METMRKYLPFVGMALGTLIAITYASMLRAHEWYPVPCCNDKDCYVLPIEGVQVTQQGYYIIHIRKLVEFERANSSPDGQYHICGYDAYTNGVPEPRIRNNYTPNEHMNRSTVCFWAPDGGA